MTEPRLIAGNWKMNGSRPMASSVISQLMKNLPVRRDGVQAVICPPAIFLSEIGAMLRDSPLALGGQDCHAETSGAFTGDISAPMLAEAGCAYVILGHSERREYHGETDAQVASKVTAAVKAGLIPIVCVGESLELRKDHRAESFVTEQLRASLPSAVEGAVAIAYEPVWAIGSGLVPSPEDIISMHAALHNMLQDVRPRVPVLYGGSVKAANAGEILDLPGVDGVLVGGASLNADEFSAIIAAAYR